MIRLMLHREFNQYPIKVDHWLKVAATGELCGPRARLTVEGEQSNKISSI